jgi:hypothetical protein
MKGKNMVCTGFEEAAQSHYRDDVRGGRFSIKAGSRKGHLTQGYPESISELRGVKGERERKGEGQREIKGKREANIA